MEVNDSAPQNNNALPLARYLPLIVVAVFVVFFFRTFESLFFRWIKWDEGLSHGLLVAGAFLILLYRSLPWRAHQQHPALYVFFIVALGLGSLSWFLFRTINIFILEQLALLPLLALFYAACFGIKTAWHHRVLLMLPIFAIPLWDHLNDVLLQLSALVVGEMVRMIDMPALIQGNSIFIPYGHILIADGCSGLRYFVIALAMGYIIAYLNHYGERRLAITLAIAALIGLVANWIRIFILILVGYQTQMQSSLMKDHEYFGWILFALLCIPAIYFAPVVHAQRQQPLRPDEQAKPRWLVPLLALSLGPIAALSLDFSPTSSPWQDRLDTRVTPVNVSRMPMAISSPTPGHRENGLIQLENAQVFVQVDHYQRQHKTDKLVPYIANLYNTEDWSQVRSEAHAPGRIIQLNHKNGLRRILQLQWFELEQYQTASLAEAKLMQVPALIQGQNRFAIVTLQSECQGLACDNALTALQQAAQQINAGDSQ